MAATQEVQSSPEPPKPEKSYLDEPWFKRLQDEWHAQYGVLSSKGS